MNAKPSSRWFRFSLRTALTLLTLACFTAAWVVQRLNWIRQRHEAIRQITAATVFFPTGKIPPAPAVYAPGSLWMFGEGGYGRITLYEDVASPQEIEWISALFSEAKIVLVNAEAEGKDVAQLKREHEQYMRRPPSTFAPLPTSPRLPSSHSPRFPLQ